MYYWLFMSFFFFKQKTAYEMRISDWSSDVCSSDLESYIASANSRLANYRRSLANARARFAQLTGHPAPDALGRPPILDAPVLSLDAARAKAATITSVLWQKRRAEASPHDAKPARSAILPTNKVRVHDGPHALIENPRTEN